MESDGEDDAYKTLASKEAYITKCVEATMNKMLPRTGAKKKAKFLTKMISDGKIFVAFFLAPAGGYGICGEGN